MSRKMHFTATLALLLFAILLTPFLGSADDPEPSPTPKSMLGGGFGSSKPAAASPTPRPRIAPVVISNDNLKSMATGHINIGGGNVSVPEQPAHQAGKSRNARKAGDTVSTSQVDQLREQLRLARKRCLDLSASPSYHHSSRRSGGDRIDWAARISKAYRDFVAARSKYLGALSRQHGKEVQGLDKRAAEGLVAAYWRKRISVIEDERAFFQQESNVAKTELTREKAQLGFTMERRTSIDSFGRETSYLTSPAPSGSKDHIAQARRRLAAVESYIDKAEQALEIAKRTARGYGVRG